MKLIPLSMVLAMASGCTREVPDMPSFQQDVMPILAANCLRCHATPVIGGAREYLRLDRFSDTAAGLSASSPVCVANPDDGRCGILMFGAASYAVTAASRVASEDSPMPPRFRLDDDQIEILQNWSAAGAQRGEPRADNQDPSAAIVSNERTGMRHALTIRVDDPDQDVVGGSLYARINNTDTFVGLLSSGAAQIAWDATGVAAGTYWMSAHLDDGAAEIVVDIGSITVGGP